VYTQIVSITNQSQTTIEATLRPGSADRYAVSPAQIRLASGQRVDVEVRLKVLRFAHRAKGEQGQRDIIHIKVRGSHSLSHTPPTHPLPSPPTPQAPFFDQKFFTTFYLARDEPSDCLAPQPAHRQLSVTRSLSPPRDRGRLPTATAARTAHASLTRSASPPAMAALSAQHQGTGTLERSERSDAAGRDDPLSSLMARLRASRLAEEALQESVRRLQAALREKDRLLQLKDGQREAMLQQERQQTQQLHDLQVCGTAPLCFTRV